MIIFLASQGKRIKKSGRKFGSVVAGGLEAFAVATKFSRVTFKNGECNMPTSGREWHEAKAQRRATG
jgi:hypothetical protein